MVAAIDHILFLFSSPYLPIAIVLSLHYLGSRPITDLNKLLVTCYPNYYNRPTVIHHNEMILQP
jgi:hypothetical protein